MRRSSSVSLPSEPGTILPAPAHIHRLAVFLRGMLLVSVILPLGFLAAYAAITYRVALGDGEEVVQRIVDILAEHTLKVFETQELVLDQVANLLSRRDISETVDVELNATLAALQKDRRQIAGIFLLDAKGDVRAGSPWVPGINAAERDYFRHFLLPQHDSGTFLGGAVIGKVTGRPAFGFSRRWAKADAFAGVMAISVSADYFTNFFHNTAREIDHVAALIRTDGEVLARDPQRPTPTPLPPDDPLMRAMAGADRGLLWRASRSDGVERLYGFRRVAGYPVVVTTAMARSAMIASWLEDLYLYAIVTFVAAFALFGLTLIGLQQVRREEQALAHAAAEARKRASTEARLRQLQKLEALGELTGGVAHDFGNLLTPIIGNLQMLRDGLDDAKLASRLAGALAAAERARTLVNSLMAFARRQELELAPLDVKSVLRDMQGLLKQSLGSKGELVLTLAPATWPVEADIAQLEMAILNLVVNARDAFVTAGRVEIETGNVTLHGEHDELAGDFVAIVVSDNGAGMPHDVLAHAFEPFFTTKDPERGTGLGLATVYGFANQCGGTATITSTVGTGTSVTIYLPRHAEADSSA
jgi:signal transduction histidine kinase